MSLISPWVDDYLAKNGTPAFPADDLASHLLTALANARPEDAQEIVKTYLANAYAQGQKAAAR